MFLKVRFLLVVPPLTLKVKGDTLVGGPEMPEQLTRRYPMRYLALLLVFMPNLVPIFARNSTDRGLMTFGGGVLSGDKDSPGKHSFFGGGGYFYLFASKGEFAQRLALGFELGRSTLGNSEEFETAYGPGRLQSQLWLLSPQVRYDILRWKYARIVAHGGYAGVRERTVLQVVDPYQFGKHWVTAGSVGQWDGAANFGLSTAFVLPRKKYSGKTVSGSWAFPVKYTRYSKGLRVMAVGLERYF